MILASLLVAELPAPIPEEEPARREQPAPEARPSPADQAPQQAPARRRAPPEDRNRPGDAGGFQTEQRPLTGPGLDPDTGKAPQTEVQGLRFGTSVDETQRQGPRAR